MKFGKKGALLLLVFTMALSVFALNVYADTDGDNGDDTPPDPPTHIAVESISFASTTATVGTPLTLSATVSPADASYRAITWSVSGTGASVVGNTLTLTAPGNVTVIATIANGTAPGAPFTREFTIAVTGPAHVPVAGITGVPLTATAGQPLSLTGTIAPANATNRTITWSVPPGPPTHAWITGNTFNASMAGQVTVTATIADGLAPNTPFTQTFTINVQPGMVPVTSIESVPTQANAGTQLTLTGTVHPTNATNRTITWSVVDAGTTGATITNENRLNTTNTGSVTVRATIVNGTSPNNNFTRDFTINVVSAHISVTSITNVPNQATVGVPLTLTGTVAPNNATNRTITWTVVTAGTTGATITGHNRLNTTATGTVTVRATIENGLTPTTNFSREFSLNVVGAYASVTGIIGVPTLATAGTPLTLTGTANPATATNRTITWSVISAGTTGATIIEGNRLLTVATGTATIRATVESGVSPGVNFTQDFAVNVAAPAPPPPPPVPVVTRRAFTTETMDNIDGYFIQAVTFYSLSDQTVSTMMNPRVFANFVGAHVMWNDEARTATFSGLAANGTFTTVVLTLDSTVVVINGESFDIAARAGQFAYTGQIRPVVINDRQFVPARILSDAFGVSISFEAGVVTLG